MEISKKSNEYKSKFQDISQNSVELKLLYFLKMKINLINSIQNLISMKKIK